MSRPPLALVAVLACAGFLLVVTGTATSAANRSEEPRRQAIINQILQQRTDVDDLDQAVAELRGQVAGARSEAGRLSQQQEQQNVRQEELALMAGTTAVEGSGIVVHMEDAPRQPGQDPSTFDASRIQDADMQLIVNALFAVGAEAVAINDNRVVAVTPIRAAGGTIVVNYRPVSSPYRIEAIGVDKKRFMETDIAQHFEQWEDKFNLGFRVDSSKGIEVPGYSGRVGIDIARGAEAVDTPTGGVSG